MTYDPFRICLLVATTFCTACTTIQNPPLLFGQSHSVGIVIGGSAADNGAELTLGYKDRDIAIVPVTVKQQNGDSTQIKGTASAGFQDALSVLGQFEVHAKATQAEASLGKFFATGLAAKRLADGFAAKLGADKPKTPSTSVAAPEQPAAPAPLSVPADNQ